MGSLDQHEAPLISRSGVPLLQPGGFGYGGSILGGAKAQSNAEPTYVFEVILPFFLLLEPEHLKTTDLQLVPISFP